MDSPYSDIHQLALDLAASRLIGGFSTPWVVTHAVLHFLESTISSVANFSIGDLKPVACIGLCRTPALFLRAEDDSLVSMSHMDSLVDSYGGPRLLAIVTGTHSSPRSKLALEFVSAFFRKYMNIARKESGGIQNFAIETVPWIRHDYRLLKMSGLDRS